MSWQDDFTWQRRFVPRMKRIIGEHLIGEAPREEDAEHNTDLIVLRMEAVRIACRVRNFEYVLDDDWREQFTIREVRPSGAKTELAKVLEGWGDYILYGFANEEGTDLCAWVLGDLRVFRLWHHRTLASTSRLTPRGTPELPGISLHNGDRSSSFRAYRLKELPSEFIVARETY